LDRYQVLLNSDLLRAIADKRLVEFVYKTGQTRLAEPHDTICRECSIGGVSAQDGRQQMCGTIGPQMRDLSSYGLRSLGLLDLTQVDDDRFRRCCYSDDGFATQSDLVLCHQIRYAFAIVRGQ
jgi:hypothetical protein